MTELQSEEVTPLDSAGIQIVALNHLFSSNRIKDRCLFHVNEVYKDTYENRKTRKAFRNQLFSILRSEVDYIKNHIRVYQKNKKVRKTRKFAKRVPTAYSEFCKKMRESKPHNEIAGKLQRLWKESKGLPIQERKREQYPEQKEEEKKEETEGEEPQWLNAMFELDSDDD
jgi:glutamyl-tRNA reductase